MIALAAQPKSHVAPLTWSIGESLDRTASESNKKTRNEIKMQVTGGERNKKKM